MKFHLLFSKKIVILLTVVFASCSNLEQEKKKAYERGYQEGQKAKYLELSKKYYGNSAFISLPASNNAVTPKFNAKNNVAKLSSGRTSDFKEIVYDVNRAVLDQVVHSLNLPPAEQKRTVEIYNELHPQIADEYLRQYTTLCSRKELNRNPEAFIKYHYYDRTEALAEVLGSQLCSTIGMIIGVLSIESPMLNITGMFAGAPCTIIASGFLKPITNDLLENGFVQDITFSKGVLEQKVSKMIFELVSVEKHYTFNNEFFREVPLFWGLFRSRANVKAEYYGIIKAGYNLGDDLEIRVNSSQRKISIVLGEPKIFDPIVYPKINSMHNGWWAQISEKDLNNMYITAMDETVQSALRDNILEEADRNSKLFLKTLFNPVAAIPPVPYEIEVTSSYIGNTARKYQY